MITALSAAPVPYSIVQKGVYELRIRQQLTNCVCDAWSAEMIHCKFCCIILLTMVAIGLE